MNYIKRLEKENAELRERALALENALRDFDAMLDSAKFHGTDINGDRKDWIATGDVPARSGRRCVSPGTCPPRSKVRGAPQAR